MSLEDVHPRDLGADVKVNTVGRKKGFFSELGGVFDSELRLQKQIERLQKEKRIVEKKIEVKRLQRELEERRRELAQL